jgi:cell division protein FtsL
LAVSILALGALTLLAFFQILFSRGASSTIKIFFWTRALHEVAPMLFTEKNAASSDYAR